MPEQTDSEYLELLLEVVATVGRSLALVEVSLRCKVDEHREAPQLTMIAGGEGGDVC